MNLFSIKLVVYLSRIVPLMRPWSYHHCPIILLVNMFYATRLVIQPAYMLSLLYLVVQHSWSNTDELETCQLTLLSNAYFLNGRKKFIHPSQLFHIMTNTDQSIWKVWYAFVFPCPESMPCTTYSSSQNISCSFLPLTKI